MKHIGVVLLAAGGATRMGTPKQLLPFRGRPLVRHTAEVALASDCSPVVVVTGAATAEVTAALGQLPVRIVHNPRWADGVGTSIGVGIEAMADDPQAAAAILALADQPLITASIYQRLVQIHRLSGQPIVASEYADTVGVPVLFARSWFPQLLALGPNQGCKGLILSNEGLSTLVPCPEAEMDIDTPGDYERLANATLPSPLSQS